MQSGILMLVHCLVVLATAGQRLRREKSKGKGIIPWESSWARPDMAMTKQRDH
jgi:hypothetical protein